MNTSEQEFFSVLAKFREADTKPLIGMDKHLVTQAFRDLGIAKVSVETKLLLHELVDKLPEQE